VAGDGELVGDGGALVLQAMADGAWRAVEVLRGGGSWVESRAAEGWRKGTAAALAISCNARWKAASARRT
jgi:hypothetical protein